MQTDARARDTWGGAVTGRQASFPETLWAESGRVGGSPTAPRAPPPSAARRESSRAGGKLNPPLGCPRGTIFIPRNQLCLGPKPTSLFSQGCSLVILRPQPRVSGSTKKQGL